MLDEISQNLGSGITCVDAGYIRPWMVSFYLLEHGGECAIIDTGTARSLSNLEQVMTARGLGRDSVRYVAPTHVHLDHAGGAGAMMLRFPAAQLLIHPRGAGHLVEPDRLVASTRSVYGEQRFRELYGDITPVQADRVVEVEDGRVISLAGRDLEFRHTRGHADHHFCIWDRTSCGWFSGDMFGICYPWFRFDRGDFVLPATAPNQFDPRAFEQSVELLASYQPRSIYLTHSGALAFSAERAQLLLRQVREYPVLACEHCGDPSAIEQKMGEYSLDILAGFNTGLGDVELMEMLAFDLDLNARGVDLWLQRQAGENT